MAFRIIAMRNKKRRTNKLETIFKVVISSIRIFIDYVSISTGEGQTADRKTAK